jgi:hypothetical protein
MRYKELIEKEYHEHAELSKLEFTGDYIFDFTTYDNKMDEYFALKMLEVIEALINGSTFTYIEASRENYINYLTMVNTPFLKDKIEWGTSIRSAWIEGIGDGYFEIGNIKVNKKDISVFLKDLMDWTGDLP